MSNTHKEVPPGSEGLIPAQQRKRKRTANTSDEENTQPCGSNFNNTETSVPLSNVFPRVLADISNIHPNLPSPRVNIGTTPTNDYGKHESGQGKRLKSSSYKLMSQSSNQTTVSNIVGGSNYDSTVLKRKRSATIDVTDHTPYTFSSKKRCAKSGVLTYITNVLPTASTLPLQLGTPSTNAKGKGKVLAGDNKFKSKTTTKSCRKTLEAQFEGCVNDNSSSEDDEDQAYQCYYQAEESELDKEQVYDCSSEESDTSDCETLSCDPDTDHRSPNVLSKTNTKTASSCTPMTKATSSRKQYGT
ncbi:hypothetical protein HID58_072245 [Brassica napus]|uniref:BnaAnng12800D protein n=2 Tax=Brassica napus TaxID=3708 RepID=A0A078IWQ5_BRANA|nr:hypothetical protein HID58_072245 [Brassica napus]CAF2061624.1 unnamed protein product [Brassica napus]CDY53814.1 BnaAnng12800D [Brassica napus]